MFEWFNKLFQTSARKNQSAIDGDRGEMVYELPFEFGKRFRVLQGYGGAYSHTDQLHYSIDFQMPEGTPVCVARSGIVYQVANHFTDGGTDKSFIPKANAIYVPHPDDSIAAYLHLKHRGNCVISSDSVRTGQIIGYSGNTGWSGTPHLHFHVMDAIRYKTLSTVFNTGECGITTLAANKWYSRPGSRLEILQERSVGDDERTCSDISRDLFAFSPELLQLAETLVDDLASIGYEKMSEYSSIEALHDVHGLEVCGIRSADDTLEITRFLLRRFRGWNAGWIHAPDSSSTDGWVARIHRDLDLMEEWWNTD